MALSSISILQSFPKPSLFRFFYVFPEFGAGDSNSKLQLECEITAKIKSATATTLLFTFGS